MNISKNQAKSIKRTCNLCLNHTFSGKVLVKEQTGSRIISGDTCKNCGSIIFFDSESSVEKYEQRTSNDFSAKKGPTLAKLRMMYRNSVAGSLIKKLQIDKSQKLTIVDYGAGNGDFAISLFNQLPESRIIAVDLAKDRPNGLPPEIEYFDLLSFLETSISTDIFILNHVLEHIENPVECLTDLSKMLKSSGQIYIEVPHTESAWRKILGKYWAGYYWPFHLFIPSYVGLQDLSQITEFKIEKSFYIERPIFGSTLMHSPLPYQLSVSIGIIFYPFQLLISKLTGKSEALGIILNKKPS